MDQSTCGCKGIRTCLLCESTKAAESDVPPTPAHKAADVWYYCLACDNGRCYRSPDHTRHPSEEDFLNISGVFLARDIVNEREESQLIEHIDKIPWALSQSGRRKHDFGPKVNFKKRKVKPDSFLGFPGYSRWLLGRLAALPVLHDFLPVEMCDLEYTPGRGSAIDPHYDDFWLWGERLVTVNLLSDTVYTLTLPGDDDHVIKVPIPRRSVIVLYSDARYKWMHSIQRGDVTSRRVGITIRELTPLFLSGDMSHMGERLLAIAKTDMAE